jgi:hypothetical protein
MFIRGYSVLWPTARRQSHEYLLLSWPSRGPVPRMSYIYPVHLLTSTSREARNRGILHSRRNVPNATRYIASRLVWNTPSIYQRVPGGRHLRVCIWISHRIAWCRKHRRNTYMTEKNSRNRISQNTGVTLLVIPLFQVTAGGDNYYSSKPPELRYLTFFKLFMYSRVMSSSQHGVL